MEICCQETATMEIYTVCLHRAIGEESRYMYYVFQPLYGMLSAAQAWHTTMSTFLEREGRETVGFEKSMW